MGSGQIKTGQSGVVRSCSRSAPVLITIHNGLLTNRYFAISPGLDAIVVLVPPPLRPPTATSLNAEAALGLRRLHPPLGALHTQGILIPCLHLPITASDVVVTLSHCQPMAVVVASIVAILIPCVPPSIVASNGVVAHSQHLPLTPPLYLSPRLLLRLRQFRAAVAHCDGVAEVENRVVWHSLCKKRYGGFV